MRDGDQRSQAHFAKISALPAQAKELLADGCEAGQALRSLFATLANWDLAISAFAGRARATRKPVCTVLDDLRDV